MYYTLQHVERICKELKDLIYHCFQPVEPLRFQPRRYHSPQEANQGEWHDFKPDDRWGSYDGHAWFQAQIIIPQAFAGQKVLLDVSVDQENWFADSRQFILFVNGKMQQGLDINHRSSVLSTEATAGERFEVDLHAYAGLVKKSTTIHLQIMIEDTRVKNLYYDIHVPCQVAAELPEGDKTRLDLLSALSETVQKIDLRKPYSKSFYDSLNDAQCFIEEHFYQEKCGKETIQATAVGHTHIDVAWLWTLAQTREKIARSFSTVLQLIKEYPEYIFMSSQPQLYSYIKEDYPEVYAQVKEQIAAGKWEAEGGMWVEADCNLVSGESFIRQFLYGQQFFADEFDVDNRILWLPDVFGYSAALPQIMKKSGIDYFMTTKINWNQYNPIPADTFNWQGLDGSTVLTHFITTADNSPVQSKPYFSTYNGYLAPRPVMRGWKRYQEKQIHEDILVACGYGDGGGGTTPDMLERGKRMARGIPGCPKVVFGTARDYFERTEAKVKDDARLKKWVGELYFEYHRGTYTSMAKNKRFNRKSELMYQDAEFLSVLSRQMTDSEYPNDELAQGWKKILLNQFHDILPGSSIAPVYDDSTRDYEEVLNNGRDLLKQSFSQLNQTIQSEGPAIIVHNTLGFKRDDFVSLVWPADQPAPQLATMAGQVVPVQKSSGQICFVAPDVPAKGYTCLNIVPSAIADDSDDSSSELQVEPDSEVGMTISSRLMENRFWKIELDEQGHMTRLFDKKHARDVLPAGSKGNLMRVFEDKPMANDNWDIDIYYQQKHWLIDDLTAAEIIERGPVRIGLRLSRRYQDSEIIQTIFLYDQLPRIDFETWIDWHEDDVLLKVEFPVDVHAEQATYDIQFGNVTRPTHWNTSWDWARFEVCAHKWVDLSETGYGVSLLNDCKYGHDIRDNIMRMTLIKCSSSPNPKADREEHRFTYSLYPHSGTWHQAQTMEMAYGLNQPLYAQLIPQSQSGKNPPEFSLLAMDSSHVLLETVKEAEDGEGMIVRFFDYKNQRGRVKVNSGLPLLSVSATNLIEQPVRDDTLSVSDKQFEFEIKPFEIKTFRVHCPGRGS